MKSFSPNPHYWLPAALAAVAFVGFAVVFVLEIFSYQRAVIEWANRDLQSRADLAAANLAEPLRTQDFRVIREFGETCVADGVRLTITGGTGGRVYDTLGDPGRDEPSYSRRSRSGEYIVTVALPAARVLAPFYRALVGFALAGLVGMAGVLLFFFVTYRQRVRIRELARLEKFRREFIADVSHEIKTPLTGILGAVDLLSDQGDEDAASPRARLLGMLGTEAKRLNGLVQSILDLARLEREGDVLNRAETDLGELVWEAVETLRPQAEAKGIALSGPGEGETCRTRIDAQLVSQAVSNLVANAIRHSGSEDVAVSLRASGDEARIVVEDHGVGIPPEHAGRVFERFHRVDPARAAETGGAGLGLAIVRQVARLHGGDVTLAPAVPSGCVFTLSIPLART